MEGTFRLHKPTMAVLTATRLAVVVPEGEIIEIPAAPPAQNRTVDVVWKGEAAMMFVQDLRDRSQKV